ncbi:CoA transferase [Nocardioides sp. WS12]|uniref:CaiB/BaiF CoA transferase family protein n=1 Tax=Nocardioides sp. WS12 TaxID=2486272 RepID=UPI0015FE3749|nr:CoA transferase [Nocardioides sp. WS12]
MPGPLEGYRVIDLSAMLSGPWAADILGDQGAEVIKLEPLGTGDHVRLLPNTSGGLASMFVNINRSKKSVAIDLKQAEGRSALLKLIATADVVIQNFRPGVVQRLGISYEELSAVNPGLVYLSISGFGEVGPYSSKRAYDPIVQAVSGLASVQAGSDDGRPRLVRTVLPDKLTAVMGAQAVCAALAGRGHTGRGQHVQLSMLDTMMSFLWATDMGAYTFADRPVLPEQDASIIDLIFETADGYITVSTMSDGEWAAFCRATDRLDLLEDKRFSTPASRGKHVDERLAEVQETLLTRTATEWLEILDANDVPCAPALRRFEVIDHPQVVASETLITTDHPVAGRLRQARAAARFSDTPLAPPRGAPLLGEHTVEVLRSIGLDDDTINGLLESGVAGAPPTPSLVAGSA